MKQLGIGLVCFIVGIPVFSLCITIGIVHNIFYPFVMARKKRDWKEFFRLWWRLINGTLATLGMILYKVVELWDVMGCVWGEWIEDSTTTDEDTLFGETETISAAIGELEYNERPMFRRTRILSKVLNIAFMEKRHALGSWLLKLKRDEIKALNLKGKK